MKNHGLYATYPDTMTPVELTEINPTHYEYITQPFTDVGSRTLTVRLYRRGTLTAIGSIEKTADRLAQRIACLEEILAEQVT